MRLLILTLIETDENNIIVAFYKGLKKMSDEMITLSQNPSLTGS